MGTAHIYIVRVGENVLHNTHLLDDRGSSALWTPK